MDNELPGCPITRKEALDIASCALERAEQERLPRPDTWAVRWAQMGELRETQVEIENLYRLIQAGEVRAEDEPTRDMIHRLVKRLRRATDEAESHLLHLSLKGRWEESEAADKDLADTFMGREDFDTCPKCGSATDRSPRCEKCGEALSFQARHEEDAP